MHSADDHLFDTVVAHGLSRRADAAGNTGVRNGTILPNRCDNVVFHHEAIAVLHKIDQQRKHLWLNLNRFARMAEQELLGIESKFSKNPCHAEEYDKKSRFCIVSSDIHQACLKPKA